MFESLKNRLRMARFYTLHRRPLKVIRAWQSRYLSELVAHAAKNIPLYKERLREVAVEKIASIDDIARLPVLHKSDFLGRPSEEYTDNSQPLQGIWDRTSGTSGKPLTFISNVYKLKVSIGEFAWYRFLIWDGWSIRSLPGIKTARIKIRSQSRPNRLFVSVADYLADPEATIRKLAAFDPLVLGSYTSILLDIARQLKKDQTLPRLAPRYAITFGEMLSPAARSYIQETLHTELYDRYGIEEVGVVAVECKMHDGFHVLSESIIVEVVDESYGPLPAGARGRVLITDLFNYNMPFIRYDTGDHGTISFEPCTCGLETPRVWIEGRYSAFLTFGDKRVHHLQLDGALDAFMNAIVQYQVAKTGPDSLEVRLVTGPSYGEDIRGDVEASVREVVGAGVDIVIRIVSQIPIMPRGKSQIVVDETTAAKAVE